MFTLTDIVAVIALVAMTVTIWKVGMAVEKFIRNEEERKESDRK